jgi:cardiolipin synthase
MAGVLEMLLDLGRMFNVLLILNAIIVIVTIIFVQKKRPESVLLWMLAFLILPLVFVLVFYLFLGRDYRNQRLFRDKAEVDRDAVATLQRLKGDLFIFEFDRLPEGGPRRLAMMIFQSQNSLLTSQNEVEYFNEGVSCYQAMSEEIAGSERFIHLEMYIIRRDDTARQLVRELAAKARQGVEVKLLLDDVGCRRVGRWFFRELTQAGGEVVYFLPSVLGPINFRINNRNHRKIMVVDGDSAFVGGFNIGDEYTGKGKLGYWRDCMVRVRGSGAMSAEGRFIQDWNFAADAHLDLEDYPPSRAGSGKSFLQIVSGGPDASDKPLEEQYVKMITSAREYVYIQTPYLVPGEAVTAALVAAAKSGIDVRVMIPSKPDHPFVYWASLQNAGELMYAGVRVHQFQKDGFVHAKLVVMDDMVVSVGSGNLDRRSFELNFESNAVIYDPDLAIKVKSAFIDDLVNRCTELTAVEYEKRSVRVRFMEAISRLYTPVA